MGAAFADDFSGAMFYLACRGGFIQPTRRHPDMLGFVGDVGTGCFYFLGAHGLGQRHGGECPADYARPFLIAPAC